MKPNNLAYNTAEPYIMHIDLNSCFAIIEQQANRLLRGRPVGVAAYDTPRGFVLAASYEAKRLGIKLGVTVSEARQLCPGIVIMTPDPSKYREAHRRFKELLLDFTSDVTAKSIDEFVINLAGTPSIRAGKSPEQVGHEIKQAVAERLGEAVTVNVGIAPNRFLAKLAAGLHKPDGLDIITHKNLNQTLDGISLLDLPGINYRYEARLRAAGIGTPRQFLATEADYLQKQVFRSIVGYHWYLRLRGWEVDDFVTTRRSLGHQYALKQRTSDKAELARILMKLCEKVGRRLRKNRLYASGIHLHLSFSTYTSQDFRGNGFIGAGDGRKSWHHGHKVATRLYSTKDIYLAALRLLDMAEVQQSVRGMSITTYDLHPCDPEQLSLLEGERSWAANKQLSDALDAINDRYGEFVVTPATMADMQGTILDRIAFGSVRDF